ncbi:hypothetical protein EBU71_12170 [bacterium]|nr:hypothetical protein [Candidatus Elulimicrobium humile]
MAKFVGSTEGLINWDSIIDICKSRTDGDFNSVKTVVDRSEGSWKDNPELLGSYREVIQLWDKAGYELEKIEWYDYYPGTHFDINVQNIFSKIVNAIPRRVFVSELWPGRLVPYHWDVEDNEKEWLLEGDLKRWTVFMDKPQDGHVFLLEDHDAFYDVPQHGIWEWDHYKNWHAGANCGYEPYYLFHFLGTPR